MAKAAAKKLPLFLSSTMLYRRETQYIKQQVAEFGKPVHYIYPVSYTHLDVYKRQAAAGAVLKPPGGNCAVLPLYSVFIVVQGRRFVNGKNGLSLGERRCV